MTVLRGFTEDGVAIGTVLLVPFVNVLEVGDAHVLGLYDDEGQPRVAVYLVSDRVLARVSMP